MKATENKYRYLEIVKIKVNTCTIEYDIHHSMGTILGYDFVENEWIYSVDIKEQEQLFSLSESDLEGTGKIDDIKNFYDDPQTEE